MESITNQVLTMLTVGDESCDMPTNILLCALCLVGLVVSCFGYRIYRCGLLAFLVAFAAEAAVGASWIGMAPGEQDAVKKAIAVVCCLLWGISGTVICHKLSAAIHKFLVFSLGAAVGAAMVTGIIYVAKDSVTEVTGEEYLGWDQFATITLGVPVAAATGHHCRIFDKYLLMLATAIMGAAVAVGSLEKVLVCAEVDMEAVSTLHITAIIVAVITMLGFGTQLYCQAAPPAKHVDAPVVGVVVGRPLDASVVGAEEPV